MINRVCFKKVDKAIALSQYPQAAHQAQLERFLLHLISPPTQLTPNTRYFSENGEVKSEPAEAVPWRYEYQRKTSFSPQNANVIAHFMKR
ncbi:hypothetical protein PDPJ_3_00080 [Photobacterium damselae subsp. piscicida]|nr:hypothetical protein PDPJ_3_00080 [Photobacterium damselae subsp. piscicida]